MFKKDIPFFATENDLSSVIKTITLMRPLQFAIAGLFDNPTIELIDELVNPASFTTYLIVEHGCPILARVVPQRDGSTKYAVDQIENPNSTSLRFGGMFKGERLVAGQLGTGGENAASRELSDLFVKAIRSQFKKIKSYYVGPEAVSLLNNGVRLTPTIKSPETYDLML